LKLARIILLNLLVWPAVGIVLWGPRAQTAPVDNRIVVDYWEKWTGDEAIQMQTIVDSFNQTVGAQKGIYVRFVSTSNINQKVLVAAAAGVPPDIAGMTGAELASFAAQGALEPLDDLAAEPGHRITADLYKKVYWDGCHFDRHLYALVSTPMSLALIYHRELFQQNGAALRAAGLDPNRAPATIAELDAYSRALTVTDPDGTIVRTGYLPTDEIGWFPTQISLWFGGKVWDDKTKKVTLTDPGVVRAYEWVASYSKRLGVENVERFASGEGTFDSPANPFMTGSIAMVKQGPWISNFIEHLKPEMTHLLWSRQEELTKPPQDRKQNYAWAAAPFPSAVPGMNDVTYCGFDTLVIPKGARHKEAAFEFIAYVNRQDVMERLCKLHCKNSPLANVSDDFLNNHPNPYIDVFEKLARSPNASGPVQIPISGQMTNELNALFDEVSKLEVEPRVGLQAAQERLQADYDHYLDIQRARTAQ
jgi:ABC-type glycerol-3-phosphate transport system substrate-binding protein